MYFIRRGRVDHQLEANIFPQSDDEQQHRTRLVSPVVIRQTASIYQEISTEQLSESEIYREPIRTLMMSSFCRKQFLQNKFLHQSDLLSAALSARRSASSAVTLRLLPDYLDFSTSSAVTQ